MAKCLRVLTEKEQLKVRILRDDFTSTVDGAEKWMRSTAAVLLEDIPELAFQLASMSDVERENFFELPIWTHARGTTRLESVVAKYSEPTGQFPLLPTEVHLAIESKKNSVNPD